MSDVPFLRRVIVKNYKSIAVCNVELGALTFLVGPNGSGKSNFLDAVRFVADALRTTLDHALRDRGGINEVRRRGSGHPNHFGMRLEFLLPDGSPGHYAFKIAAKPRGAFEVQTEECVVRGGNGASFRVESGVRTGAGLDKPVPGDRLHLVAASGETEFRPVYDSLSHMAFYNLNPDRMRELQTSDSGELLARDGSNATSVFRLLGELRPKQKLRIEEYLSKVVPGVKGVEARVLGPRETLEFQQEVAGAKNPWHFLAANMSDGTLRALGILLSLFQTGNGKRITLVGMEEPEIALHPAAAGILLDALREASGETQIVVTSHSPDLLDIVDLNRESILAVHAEKGDTEIAPIDPASVAMLRRGLYTPGELLRLGQLEPDTILFGESTRQLHLFDKVPA
ncbi:MAG: AAA family ATPase [Acidobacteria bacterium]|nr:AAA family ATPase [Acidobacteriota bacterium]